MGGRGATSSLARLSKYGTEFQQVKKNSKGKNFKIRDKWVLFVTSATGKGKTPYESMMPHRVYAVIRPGKGTLHSVVFTNRMGHAYKFIDVNASHEGIGRGELAHVHIGYDRKYMRRLRKSERKLIRRLLLASSESVIPKLKPRGGKKK